MTSTLSDINNRTVPREGVAYFCQHCQQLLDFESWLIHNGNVYSKNRCRVNDCLKTFDTRKGLKAHVYQDHGESNLKVV